MMVIAPMECVGFNLNLKIDVRKCTYSKAERKMHRSRSTWETPETRSDKQAIIASKLHTTLSQFCTCMTVQ